MPLTPPSTLSPSKVSAFKDCALAFRFSAIDRLPEPPSVAATRGSVVHRALELLFCEEPTDRTLSMGLTALARALDEFQADPDFTGLGLDGDAEAAFVDEAQGLVHSYFELEDPRAINPIGLELQLEARIGDLRLRGIIDRLELDDDGHLVVTDYKTGRAPSAAFEQSRLGGVHFYSYLCEQLFGQRPARIQLLYLKGPTAIVNTPTDQSTRGLERRVGAIWQAVQRACEREDFRPRPSRLCDWCTFKPFCPAYGGDPTRARQTLLTPPRDEENHDPARPVPAASSSTQLTVAG